MTPALIDQNDSLERQNEKLLKITAALMRRVEDSTNASGPPIHSSGVLRCSSKRCAHERTIWSGRLTC